MSDGVIIELLLIFDASSPSTVGLTGLIGIIYIVTLLVLICLRDKRKRTGPTREKIAMMISICTVFFIPILVSNFLVDAGLIEQNSPIVIISVVAFLIVLYSFLLIVVYGTKK